MTRPLALAAALAGWSAPALAAEIDDSATWNLPASSERAPAPPGRHARSGSHGPPAARSHAAPGHAAPTRATRVAPGHAPPMHATRVAPSGPAGGWHGATARSTPTARSAPTSRAPTAQGPRYGRPPGTYRTVAPCGPQGCTSTTPSGGGARPDGSPTHGSTGATTTTTTGGPPPHDTRPGTTVVHTPPASYGPTTRPGTTVVHGGPVTRPGGPPRSTVVYGAPAHTVVVHHAPVRTVTYTRVEPYHGVFVYGPRPATHVTYVQQGPGPVEVKQRDLPEREIDRDKTLALGVMGGALVSSTPEGTFYGDPSIGVVGRYRPAEPVALELGLAHSADAFSLDEKRSQTQVNGDVKLFAFPWTRFSPYALGGVTWNAANIEEPLLDGSPGDVLQTVDSQWGLDGGLGLELAMGNNFALDLQGKYVGWLDERLPGEAPGAFQLGGGLAVHFR